MTAPPPRREATVAVVARAIECCAKCEHVSGRRALACRVCIEKAIDNAIAARDAELAEAKAELAQAKREAEWLRKLIKEGLAIDTEKVSFLYFPPGKSATPDQYEPGDFILTHSDGIVPRLIRYGSRLRFRGARRQYAHWSHSAIVVQPRGGIVEADARGVQQNHLSCYDNVEYILVSIESVVTPATSSLLGWSNCSDRAKMIAFVNSCVGHAYSYLAFAGLALGCLTGGTLTLGYSGQDLCSGLVARALERTWFISPRLPESMMPGDLAEYFEVRDWK